VSVVCNRTKNGCMREARVYSTHSDLPEMELNTSLLGRALSLVLGEFDTIRV
jgi:hypothetical protein